MECNLESALLFSGSGRFVVLFWHRSQTELTTDRQSIVRVTYHVSFYVNPSKCEPNSSLQLFPLFSNNISNSNVAPKNVLLERN